MIYEYECPGCGDVRQVERKMSDLEETIICTQCHNEFRRKWSAPSIVFNGSGFYSTDNKRG
jgi:putative FmdB family regulatory protein